MQQVTFTIRINNRPYNIDDRFEQFFPQGKHGEDVALAIPLNRFRYKEEAWYILWDKKCDTYYDISNATQGLPLTVEWIKVNIGEQTPGCKERIDLLIVLSETMDVIRHTSGTGDLKKAELTLKKNISQFLARND